MYILYNKMFITNCHLFSYSLLICCFSVATLVPLIKTQSSVSYTFRTNAQKSSTSTTRNLSQTELENIDFKLPVIVLIHGWLESSENMWYNYLSESYFHLMECTVIFVDWSQARGFYILAALNVKGVGDSIGTFLTSLQKYGLDLTQLHLIGFSLGAHVSANAARRIRSLTNLKVKRITALDPAGPLFTLIPDLFNISVDLEPTDAVVVDVLHTSAILGDTKTIGTVDFYANALFLPLQPGCLLIEFCSHLRAPIYFNESILSCGMLATPIFRDGTEVIFGQHLSANTTGGYYFTTNSMYPFSQGNVNCR